MSSEIWLKTNRRAYFLLAIVPLSLVAGSLLLGFVAASRIWQAVSVLGLIAGTGGLVHVVRQALRPRLAYRHGKLLLYLHGARPIELPIEIVECFFLGQGASFLPKPLEGTKGAASETATVVVRLAEAATAWRHRDVRPSLGQWCEGYITIRGTWCEPLNGTLVGGLNQRLVAAHRALKQVEQTVIA